MAGLGLEWLTSRLKAYGSLRLCRLIAYTRLCIQN